MSVVWFALNYFTLLRISSMIPKLGTLMLPVLRVLQIERWFKARHTYGPDTRSIPPCIRWSLGKFLLAISLALLSTGKVGSYVAPGHNARVGQFQQNGTLAWTPERKRKSAALCQPSYAWALAVPRSYKTTSRDKQGLIGILSSIVKCLC